MIFSISGSIGAGKDEVGKILKNYGLVKVSFAESLKDAVAAIFNLDREMLEGTTPESRAERDKVIPYWDGIIDTDQPVTSRYLLEHVATEIFRQWCPPIWIKSALQRAQQHIDNGKSVYFTDTRFINEFLQLDKMGSFFIGVHRRQPDWVPMFYRLMDESGVSPATDWSDSDTYDHWMTRIPVILKRAGLDIHSSKWQHLLWNKYNCIIDNRGDLRALQYKVEQICHANIARL